jgi:hypothetical protein
MQQPPIWTQAELEGEAAAARELFRKERISEPLENWKAAFERYQSSFERLFAEYNLSNPAALTPAQVTAIFQEQLGPALRYIAGPPISEDDLKVLAEVPSLAPSRLDADAAQRILATILQALDPKRFPWIESGRGPTEVERAAAVLASAALITAQRVATDRRSESKGAQERALKEFLRGMQFVEVPARNIRTLDDAPARASFCAESMVGSRKADVPVRLFDGRLMPIECKVLNSALNSVKRINNDAAVKARIWRDELGRNQVVPVALLSGVFRVANLIQAQSGGLTLFWAHRLEKLQEFIEATR